MFKALSSASGWVVQPCTNDFACKNKVRLFLLAGRLDRWHLAKQLKILFVQRGEGRRPILPRHSSGRETSHNKTLSKGEVSEEGQPSISLVQIMTTHHFWWESGWHSGHHPGLPPLPPGFHPGSYVGCDWLISIWLRGFFSGSPPSTKINFPAKFCVVERIDHEPLTREPG